ncbi:MAG: glycosyltransferase, partial [Acidobacteria bacterium]|nr:glycosyltransferase [Acidobacteriota bacterium]
MGFIHDRLVAEGHTVDYFCAEDVPARLDGRLSRFTFPLLVRRHAARAARAGRPYDIINIHEPSSAAVAVNRKPLGHPRIVVTTHGVERRGWELALEELRLGREGPTLKTRLVYPATSLWQSGFGLRHADHIFCLNFEDRDYLVRHLSLPERAITRIYPGANPIYAEQSARRSYGHVERLLFAGTWLSRKGT